MASQHETGGSLRSPLASTVAGGAWEPALGPGRADGRLVAESAEPASMAKLEELPGSLHPELAAALRRTGSTPSTPTRRPPTRRRSART